MRPPEHLNALRAFEAAARHLSFAKAAQELHVTPAAVGQLVRRLEEILEVELFHRSQAGPARLILTEAAHAALPDLRAGFERLSAATDRLRSARSQRTLTVTVALTFADRWLLHRLDGFRRKHPRCDLRIDTSTRILDFAAEPVDVGIRFGPGSWPGLTATYLTRDVFFPVCSPALGLGRHPLRRPKDLQHHQLIHDTSMASTPGFPTWRDWFAKAGLDIEGSEGGLRTNDSAAAYRMAITGQGVAMGRTTLVEQDLAEGRLMRPFGPDMACALAYYVVCRPREADDPMIVAFRDWLLDEAAPTEPRSISKAHSVKKTIKVPIARSASDPSPTR